MCFREPRGQACHNVKLVCCLVDIFDFLETARVHKCRKCVTHLQIDEVCLNCTRAAKLQSRFFFFFAETHLRSGSFP